MPKINKYMSIFLLLSQGPTLVSAILDDLKMEIRIKNSILFYYNYDGYIVKTPETKVSIQIKQTDKSNWLLSQLGKLDGVGPVDNRPSTD